ncbi:hypothetical protein OAF82_00530 [bacterium]|nr:hypothetical protein [bacterium]
MSDEKRAALLMQYMDKLRDKNPAASSYWVRQQAEALVEKKLGPEHPPPPLPDPRAEVEPVEEEQPKTKPPFPIPKSGEGLQVFGWVLFALGILMAFLWSWVVAAWFFSMWAVLVGTGAICSHMRANTVYVKRVYESLEASASSGESR